MTIDALLNDAFRGATSIFRDALDLFLTYDDPVEIREDIKKLAFQFPAMGLFQNLDMTTKDLGSINEIHWSLSEFSRKLNEDFSRVITSAGNSLPDETRVITISHSSYVRQLILQFQEKIKIVYCLRSGPMNEGERLCEILKRNNIKADIIEDDYFGSAVSKTSLVIVGSDLLSNGYFINKKGTRSLVECGIEKGIQVWILGDSLRFVPYKDRNDLPPAFEKIPVFEQYRIFM